MSDGFTYMRGLDVDVVCEDGKEPVAAIVPRYGDAWWLRYARQPTKHWLSEEQAKSPSEKQLEAEMAACGVFP